MWTLAAQLGLVLGVPGLVLWGCRRSGVLRAISPVILCYVIGIGAGNALGFDAGAEVAGELAPAEENINLIAGVAVMLALGLLIASTDFMRWLRLAPVTLLGSALSIASIMIVATGCALAFRGVHPELWKVSGMLVGVYSGGTVNLAAIGRALEVDSVTWGVVHTSDVVVTGVWFLVLLSVGPWIYGRFLRPFQGGLSPGEAPMREPPGPTGIGSVVVSFGIGLGLVLPGIGLSQLIALIQPALEEPTAIIGATTVAIGASFIKKIRCFPGLYAVGDYLLLVFCVAIGTLATWRRVLGADPVLLGYTTLVVFLAVALHAALCWLFRVDRDTTVITSVAALYGPPFIPPVARALKNREILVSGVTAGLVGLALGNYLGISVAFLVRWLTP
ncbi:MAG: DUF819 family protein [Deltaproteobacteria bacterium]|nr:MAG: DUF819 family protein [Deltaproteobacteria bacterium]